MIVKRFVQADRLQQLQQKRGASNASILTDLAEIVLQLGHIMLDPSYKSSVANVSTEKNFLKNFFFYKNEKMNFHQMIIASKITTVVQEALISNQVFDEVGFGNRQQYSMTYGQYFSYINLSQVKVKLLDHSAEIMIYPTPNQVRILNSHFHYFAELSQAIRKVGNYKMFEPKLNESGWLSYPVADMDYNSRLNFSTVDKITVTLSNPHEWGGELKRNPVVIPITSDLVFKPDHMLITARTGMGKTQLALALIAESSWLAHTILYFLDPKHSDLSSFGKLLGEGRYADSTEDINNLIKKLCKIMDKRYEIMRKLADEDPAKYVGKSAVEYGFEQITVYFDEVSAHLASDKSCLPDLKRLMMLSRQAGISIVLILQDPRSTGNLPSTIKDQAGVRIALGELSGTVASLIFGSGTQLPEISRGVAQGFISIDGADPLAFDAPKMPTSSAELYELMETCLLPQKQLDPLRRNYVVDM